VECVRQLGNSITSKGHTVEIAVCGDHPNDEWLARFPVKAHAFGPGVGKYAYTPRLLEWLRENGPGFDAWIINGLWQFQGLAGSRIARELGIPYFVYAHGMLDPWNRRATPGKYVKKMLYWLLAERATLEKSAGLVFTSQAESVLARSYFPTSNWCGIVVGNGIADPPPVSNDHAREFRAEHSIPADKSVLLFLGRIHSKKGIDILLRAFSSVRPLRERSLLVIAGDGEASYVASLKRMSAELGLTESVRWLGPVYGHDKWRAFSAADLFILPSHQENFGIAVVEALAMGTPVCTTTGVNIHGVLQQYDAGLICNDDQAGVVSALETWQVLGDSQIKTLGTNARRCFEDQFRIDSASNKLLDAITTAVARSRGNYPEAIH